MKTTPATAPSLPKAAASPRACAALGDGVDLGRNDERHQVGARIEEQFEEHESGHGGPDRPAEFVGRQQDGHARGAEDKAPRLGPHVVPAVHEQQAQYESQAGCRD